MAYDIVKKKQVKRDWCCGIGDDDVGTDLPHSAKGYIPETFWGMADMEAKVSEFMATKRGPFGLYGKPTRAEAVKMLTDHMRDNKIGPKDVTGVGSVVFSSKEQDKLYNKIDDVRYDIRKAGAFAGAGIAAIAGSVAVLGLAEMFRVIKGRA